MKHNYSSIFGPSFSLDNVFALIFSHQANRKNCRKSDLSSGIVNWHGTWQTFNKISMFHYFAMIKISKYNLNIKLSELYIVVQFDSVLLGHHLYYLQQSIRLNIMVLSWYIGTSMYTTSMHGYNALISAHRRRKQHKLLSNKC